MLTVHEVSGLTGVSVRTLHHYDAIGLLKPTQFTEAGYRLYDDEALGLLQSILLFRELEFPLKDIKNILQSDSFDIIEALEDQIELLLLKRERIDKMIALARKIQNKGELQMDFSAFDDKKTEQYAAQAKEKWGATDAYKEYEHKSEGRTKAEEGKNAEEMMNIFAELGAVRASSPESSEAQALIKKLQEHISKNYYNCTPQILKGLGQMYAAGGEMTDNIDKAGGEGTAAFANKAIEYYCAN